MPKRRDHEQEQDNPKKEIIDNPLGQKHRNVGTFKDRLNTKDDHTIMAFTYANLAQ